MVGRHDKIFTSPHFDAVEALFSADNIKGFSRAAVRTEKKIALLDILDVDLSAVVERETRALGKTGL